jgi:hypothetical protein
MRMTTFCVLFVLTVAVPGSVQADALSPEAFLAETDEPVLIARLFTHLSTSGNECTDVKSCSDLYQLDYVGTAKSRTEVLEALPAIKRAHVSESDTLELSLSDKLHIIPDLQLNLLRLATEGPKREVKLVRRTVPLAPDIFLDPLESNTFNSLIYRGVRLRKPTDIPPKEKVKLTVKDANGKPVSVTISGDLVPFSLNPKNVLLWRIPLSRSLQRGANLSVAVEGIDEIGTVAKLQVKAPPSGRDDATFYLRGQQAYNHYAHNTGSIDAKWGRSFFDQIAGQELWFLLQATMGTKALGLSQTGTASLGLREWLNEAWALSEAPTFRTDRDLDNRDLGVDIALEGQPACLYHTIDFKNRKNQNKNAQFGWWLKPKLGIEVGKHLASTSNEVEGDTFLRAVPSVNLLLESKWGVKLTVDAAARYLSKDEVALDKNDVVHIKDGLQPYLRAELAYDFGTIGVSVVHENGQLPPAFKKTKTTTIGLTLKF